MSENETPPGPSKQTTSIPLKKETVRVTLKAADAPPAAPIAPSEAPVRPPTPLMPPTATVPGGAPRPPAPAPTIPLRAPGAPTVPGAPIAPPRPTMPPSAGAPPAPAPTIPLRPAGVPTRPSAPAPVSAPVSAPIPAPAATGIPAPVATGIPAPGPTIALPKATVQLQPPTRPLGAPSVASAPIALAAAEEEVAEEEAGDKLVKILSIVGLVAAVIVLGFQLSVASIWIKAPDQAEENQGWGQLFSSSDS